VTSAFSEGHCYGGRRFPRPWLFEPIPGGYRVIDANGLALAHVYGEPASAIAARTRLTYINAGSLDLPKRLPVPEVASHLVCSICGAKNSDTYHPIWARPDARSSSATVHYPDYTES
jgi:hypothetical protein